MTHQTPILAALAQDSGYMPDAPVGLTLAVFAVIIALTVAGFVLAARLVPKDRTNSDDEHRDAGSG